MIISIQSQKGGVGKTTLSINLSYALTKKRSPNKVLLVDSDPQGSARDWANAREDDLPFMVVGLDRPTIHRDLPLMAQDYDYVVIDGAPRVSDLARSGILAADLVVIPVQPSPYDIWAVAETVKLIDEASVFKETLKSVFVINRKIVNTAIGRDVAEALEQYSIPVAKTKICQRVIFAESAVTGQAVLETSRNNSAVKEIKSLAKELLSYA
jgi:chromosome partitioning protein